MSKPTVPPAPMIDEMSRGRKAKPASEVPPEPAPAAPADERHQAGELRIVPARREQSVPNLLRYQQLYRSIPYIRSAYQVDPMYRHEIALSLLFNRFPPAPTIMSPDSSHMGPGGPMSFGRGSRRSGPPHMYDPMGSPRMYDPPVPPPGMVPEF